MSILLRVVCIGWKFSILGCMFGLNDILVLVCVVLIMLCCIVVIVDLFVSDEFIMWK